MNTFESIRWLKRKQTYEFCSKCFSEILKFRQPRFFLVIWITVTLGFGEANISTAVQGALVQQPSPTILGCHKRLYTYRITQADDNGKIIRFFCLHLK